MFPVDASPAGKRGGSDVMKRLARCWFTILSATAVALIAVAPPVSAQTGGETCANATVIPCGDVNVATNTASHVDDYDQGGACTGFASEGPDVVFKFVLASGATADLTFDAPYDASVYLITDCNDPSGSCVSGSDTFPPGVPDHLLYTNATEADQTVFLIIDGFSSTAFGPGALHGTIGCAGPPSVVAACCNRSTGACSIISNIACAAADGIFQGEGTVCSPTPCPPAESRCVLPGLTVSHDASGDEDTNLGSPQQDVQRVSMAEPYAGGSEELDITIKVPMLAADPTMLPLNSLWTVFFEVLGETFPRKFVQMTSCDPQEIPSFVYGHAEPQATGGDLNLTDGPVPGSYTPDGTIHFALDPSLVGVSPGTTLTAVSGQTFLFAPGGACTGLINTIDTSPEGTYDVKGNDFCKPFTVACPPDFAGSSNDGNLPLSFTVDNPSTTPRRFNATLTDANGWLVSGGGTTLLDVAAGASGIVSASIHITSDCSPSATDPIQLVVNASDLPSPNNRQECTTTATCEPVVNAVGEGVRSFSFALGPNPVRGQGTLTYSLPEHSRVSIEVFGVGGQRLRTLVNRIEGPGAHSVPFHVHDLGAGIYMVR